jgi:hypothetical protein
MRGKPNPAGFVTPMNLDQLEADLPHGFHDSFLRTFSSDMDERRAEFVLDVWVGDLNGAETADRERYRPARLELLGLSYLTIDDRDPRQAAFELARVQIDSCAADDDPERAQQVPAGGFAGRFFVAEWNAFIHFAASEARLTWLGTN